MPLPPILQVWLFCHIFKCLKNYAVNKFRVADLALGNQCSIQSLTNYFSVVLITMETRSKPTCREHSTPVYKMQRHPLSDGAGREVRVF
jgi:hypothetical protein